MIGLRIAAACLLLPLSLLAGCKQTSKDGYRFETKEFAQLAPDISIVEHPSQQDLINAAPAATREAVAAKGEQLMAWSILRGVDRKTCVVHIVDPAVSYVPEFLGHELAHCLYGRWHS